MGTKFRPSTKKLQSQYLMCVSCHLLSKYFNILEICLNKRMHSQKNLLVLSRSKIKSEANYFLQNLNPHHKVDFTLKTPEM